MDVRVRPRNQAPEHEMADFNLYKAQGSKNERVENQMCADLLFRWPGNRPQRVCVSKLNGQQTFLPLLPRGF